MPSPTYVPKEDPSQTMAPTVEPTLSQAAILGLPGATVPAPTQGYPGADPAKANIPAPPVTAPIQHDPNAITMVNGQVTPYPFGPVNPTLNLTSPPAVPVEPKVTTPKAVEASVAAGPPTVKTMVGKILSSAGAPTSQTQEGGFNFGDFLKGAGGKLGDFLQRWGMGLQGAPTGLTQGDIQRAQAFELQKTQVQAQVAAQQMALDNQYQTQRMQLQNQMNIANLPIEAKQQLANQIATLDAEYNNQVKLIPLQVQQMMAQRQWLPGANPADHLFSQGQ